MLLRPQCENALPFVYGPKALYHNRVVLPVGWDSRGKI
jgi:hypothetical protein